MKKTLLQQIDEHEIYVEVFCGSAKLLFAKDPSPVEVINDANGDIANFFRVVKHRQAELAELFEREVVHAARFRELREGLVSADELERAHRFAYLVWYSYGARSEHFAGLTAKTVSDGGRMRRPLDQVRTILDATAARLQRVLVEQRDFAEILRRYDSAATFFYLDPPYVNFGNIGQYAALSAEQREMLFDVLSRLKARWLMSFDDCTEVRSLAKSHGFRVRRVEVTYSLSHTPGTRGRRGEVLISPK